MSTTLSLLQDMSTTLSLLQDMVVPMSCLDVSSPQVLCSFVSPPVEVCSHVFTLEICLLHFSRVMPDPLSLPKEWHANMSPFQDMSASMYFL